MTKPALGVCYFPEHWPRTMWDDDARKMAEIGIQRVRIGEFSWSRTEPEAGRYDFDWLDDAIDVLGKAGLNIILATPTATPPKWLIDTYPDILAYDKEGRPRKFGSRRHYCFSSATYRRETKRIVAALAERYGRNDHVVAWQTDNEYGCHDTVRSYSPEAERCFRIWLKDKYKSITALNAAWGNVFWSMEYRSFDEVDLPNLTTTEANPSHWIDFYRFSSDQVVSYNRLQTDILRELSPGRELLHNFMGFFFDFDHFDVMNDLDSAGWDSYPLGFLDVAPFPQTDKARFMRQGHPDCSAFHHDLYRACGAGRWQVVEQQPGPVNWADHNPAPLPGMMHLWAAEAAAHGAQAVSYFRWRQAPFAQEQMHAGLEYPDGAPSPAFGEAAAAARDFDALSDEATPQPAEVCILFDYETAWLFEAQPQGKTWNYAAIVFEWYAVLRRLGLNVDIVSRHSDFDQHKVVIVPSLPIISEAFLERVKKSSATFLFGPRSGSKTDHLTIPYKLAPGALTELIPIRISQVESFPSFHTEKVAFLGSTMSVHSWLDHIQSELAPLAATTDGKGVLYNADRFYYLGALPDHAFLAALFMSLLSEHEIAIAPLPEDLRMRRRGDQLFIFNYGPVENKIPDHILGEFGMPYNGETFIAPASFAIISLSA